MGSVCVVLDRLLELGEAVNKDIRDLLNSRREACDEASVAEARAFSAWEAARKEANLQRNLLAGAVAAALAITDPGEDK